MLGKIIVPPKQNRQGREIPCRFAYSTIDWQSQLFAIIYYNIKMQCGYRCIFLLYFLAFCDIMYLLNYIHL